MGNLPIDPIILKKRMRIPVLLAELSYLNEKAAIDYLRMWGEHKIPVTTLHDQLDEKIKNIQDFMQE